MKKVRRSRRNRRDSRGSALLVSLMVIVGLSLLGLGFVAISETESAIAKNEQNALQTQAIAEAGARMIVEWFQDPQWAESNAAMPLNSSSTIASGIIPAAGAIKTQRVIPAPQAYTGVYKPQTAQRLCDKPYRQDNGDRFYGDEDHADIIINRTTSVTTIDAFNNKLLASDASTATDLDKLAGEVTEIKIFAPPIVNGTLSSGFWSGGQRYGVATIKVTAQQFQNPVAHTGVIASHSVRLVVGELPLPIPAGPIQGDANVSFGGNFRVHWGMETSRGDLTPSLDLSALPWANAYERPHFEHGYEQGTGVDAIVVTAGGSGYSSAPAVTISGGGGAGATATATVANGAVLSIAINTAGSGYNPDPALAPTVSFSGGGGGTGATAVASVGREIWPVVPGSVYDDRDYFHEVLGKDFQDPWYGARAYQDNMMDGATAYNVLPQCYPYSYTADEQTNSGPSYAFQWQDANEYPLKKKVTFPVIKYDYWKKITQAGRGYQGIYYFKYDAPYSFKKFGQGTAHPIAYWVNTVDGAKLGPGVYFFDTKTGANPQSLTGASRAAVLTEAEDWQANDFGNNMLMSGFVYLNTASFGTTGQGSKATTIQANFPGEPFRDVGYPKWDTANNRWADCGGQVCREGIGDSKFSCQDLQTGSPHSDGRCRIVVMQAPSWNSYDPGQTAHITPFNLPQCGSGCSGGKTVYVVKTWKSVEQATRDYGAPCVAPPANWDGTQAAGNYCSEPHEPYLNLVYPDKAANNNGAPYNVVVGWEPPNDQTTRSKTTDSQGNAVACSPPDPDRCISNSYDVDGAVVPLDVILYGILYDEGQWGSEGNAWFFGSVLVQDTINLSSGTADVWFDEKLLKGTWAPPKMPRVIVFNEQTDEQQQ
jgi:hypothetical protein